MEATPTLDEIAERFRALPDGQFRMPQRELWRFICYDRGHEHHGTWADNETPRCHLMVPCASAFCPGPHLCGSPLIRKERT